MLLTPIKLKRVYQAPADDDGMRILVERLWPRGLSKAAAAIDHWAKDVAPSTSLRRWFGHRPERWDEFRRRYRAELETNGAAVDVLRALCAKQPTTFVYATKDVKHNGAVVLREFFSSPPRSTNSSNS